MTKYLILHGWKDGSLNVAVPFNIENGNIVIKANEITKHLNDGIELIKNEEEVKVFFSLASPTYE